MEETIGVQTLLLYPYLMPLELVFFPKELILGIITALQKPRKKKGPIENLRPITLLSVLRKILATFMMKRIGEKINKEIPISQAAYCKGRSTTEHVFACEFKL